MPETRKLAAIMFTDIVGYTALMGENEGKTIALIRRNKEIHKKFIRKFNGKWLKEMGDGVLSSFQTISDAVYCAGSILKEVEKVKGLNLRIGIHLGEIVVDGKEIYGDGVNIASRIEGLVDNGQIFVSETIYRNIKNKDGIQCKYIGSRQLKNITEPLNIYSVNISEYPTQNENWKSKNLKVIISIAASILIASAVLLYYSRKAEQTVIIPAQIRPLTSSALGLIKFPTFSPDGSSFAYTNFNRQNTDIIITNRGSSNVRNLTNSPYEEYTPVFSPDGLKIAYFRINESGVDLYWMTPFGGASKKIATTGLHILEQSGEVFFGLGRMPWSPDSKRIIYPRLNNTGGISIWEVNIETGNLNQITYPESGIIDLAASYNKDGTEIAFLRNYKLWIIDVDGKEKSLVSEKNTIYLSPAFTNNDDILFSSSQLGSFYNIWKYSASNELVQITNTNNQSWYPIVTPQNTIAWEEFHHQTDLVYLDLETNESRRLTSHLGDNSHPSVSPDGQKVAYQSNRTGNNEIWIYNIKSGEEYLLTNNPYNDISPDWSPNGNKIVFLSNRSGDYGIWVTDTTGTPPLKLTKEPINLSNYRYDYAMELCWAPDGKKIGYIANSEKGRSFWIVNSDGTNQEMVIGPIHSFDWYVDSETIVYNEIKNSELELLGLRIRNIATGEDSLLYSGRLTEIFVSPTGNSIGFTYDVSYHNQSLYILSKQGNGIFDPEPFRLTNGKGLWHAHMATWFPDGKSIVYMKDTDRSNILELINP
jgi:Tol biopolymer transport system component